MASWDQLGELANVAQLTGLDAVRLIGLIARAANAARLHRRNCRQFAQHLRLIGNLLQQLRVSELRRRPETREPLEGLEDALRRSFALVDSCRNRSYLYLLAMGWSIVYQFRKAQTEIDRYLRIVPLITLVDNARVRERLEYIEMDEREYTLDEEDRRVQDAILDREPSTNHTVVLQKSLSCSYPNLPFDEALQKENEKLHLELQRSQASMDIGQCEVIQHLIGVTQNVASTLPDISGQLRISRKFEQTRFEDDNGKKYVTGKDHTQHTDSEPSPRNANPISSARDLISDGGSHRHEEWHSDLLDCCSEPYLCMKTFFCPCGTLSKIATVAKSRHISPAEACNDLMAYSLIFSCCCYTCCIRKKLRKMLNIKGGSCDDFLSHLMCCCCALVQEWREVEIHGIKGAEKTKTRPPPLLKMES
ncbi:cell number regulator 13-like [Iris pallida]|uniref:Cell number regulator 13-like n=1 Tax=Iris pallida TaxID=29817 RepID=A0AAX6HC20_IRIPA|nr:cell number regulator 13-like [Iris pallida]